MGSGASIYEPNAPTNILSAPGIGLSDDSAQQEQPGLMHPPNINIEFSDSVKKYILSAADELLSRSTSDVDVLQAMRTFDLKAAYDTVQQHHLNKPSQTKAPPSYVSPGGPAQLLSVSIFHRHGSRGPGESELKPWTDRKHPVVAQWLEPELENITQNGRYLLRSLGKWFTERYLLSSGDPSNTRHLSQSPFKNFPETKVPFENLQGKRSMWRCSSSQRAQASGDDFTQAVVRTYNHPQQMKPVPKLLPVVPDRFEDVQGEQRKDDHGTDHYFRPWNVHKREVDEIKKHISTNLLWVTKANGNKEFLTRIFAKVGTDASFQRDVTKMLWASTYLLCIYECEKFWTTDKTVVGRLGTRDALIGLIGGTDSADYLQLVDLALWAWSHRFVFQPFLTELGGRITFEMLQQTLQFRDGALNIFSGHDYTMIGILSTLQILQAEGGMKRHIEFGAYIAMELWSNAPPPHPSQSGSKKTEGSGDDNNINTAPGNDTGHARSSEGDPVREQEQKQEQGLDQRVLRILVNDAPFDPEGQQKVHATQSKFSRARDPREQEIFMYAWPVREDRERVAMQMNMAGLQILITDLYQAMAANPELVPVLRSNKTFAGFLKDNF